MQELNEQHVAEAEERARKAMEEVRRLQLAASGAKMEVRCCVTAQAFPWPPLLAACSRTFAHVRRLPPAALAAD